MTRTRTTIPLVIVVALAFAAAPGTRGSVPLRESDGVVVKWDLGVSGQPNVKNGKITYYADSRGSLDVPSADDEVKAVRRAFAAWEAVGRSAVAFEEDKTRIALKQSSTDRVNLVRWEEGTIGPFTLALAFPYSQNGVLTDADLILNDYFDWETATPGMEFHADTQAVVTHEIGHLIGLDHVPLGKSTMYFSLPLGAISPRTLEPEDENGISALYPNPDTIHQVGAIQGRATVSGPGDDRGVLIVVLDLFSHLPAASAATVEGGQYRIDGLEPGLYRVLALPLRGTGGMVPYWVETRTDFLGQPYGAGVRNPGRPKLVKVTPNNTTFGIDFPDLGDSDDSNEPNDTPARAVPIGINEMAVGLAEDVQDEDWFTFTASSGDRISIHVDSWHVGGDANVEVELLGPGLTSVARSLDIRAPVFPENRTSIDGVDIDAMLSSVLLPEDGTYHIKVDFSANSNYGTTLNYYVLSLYGDHYTPDVEATVAEVWPPVIPADGVHIAEIRIEPRNLVGDLLPPGMEVTVQGQGLGDLGPMTDHGDGTYSVRVTSPTTAALERFTVRLQSNTGGALLANAVRIDYVGPPDPDRSGLSVEPRRIPADGESTTQVTLRARDSRGVSYGPGLQVVFDFADEQDGSLSAVSDEGDGRYRVVVTAPDEESEDQIRARIAGQPVGLTADIHYGFSLERVIETGLEDIEKLLSLPDLTRKVRRRLQRARFRLETAKGLLSLDDARSEWRGVSRVSKAARLLKKARKKAKGIDFPDIGFELAEAARLRVSQILNSILFNPPDARGEARIRKAKNRLFNGVEWLDDGVYDRALMLMARALRVAEPYR